MKLFSLFSMVCLPFTLLSQNWFPVGAGLRLGGGNDVNTLAEFNGQLIAGGDFQLFNGTDTLGRIARFDGTEWLQMSDHGGFDHQVNALAVFNSELYAAGQFTEKEIYDGTEYEGNIARWDGNQWVPVPGIDGNTVDALVVYDNKLCMAHDAVTGSVVDIRVSCYDGNSWTTLPGSFKGPVNYFRISDMCVYNNNLVVVGRFDSLGTQAIRMVALWDGTQWINPGFPVNGRTELAPGLWVIEGEAGACKVLNGELYVGGGFPTYNFPNNEPSELAKWDGTSWTNWGFGNNGSGGITDIVPMGDTVFVLGGFQAYHPLTNEYQWGAATFQPDSSYYFFGTNFYPGSSVSTGGHNINCGILFNNELYAGGDFTHAGTNQVDNITRFDPTPLLTSSNARSHESAFYVYPNPAYDWVQLSAPGIISEVTLTDVAGRIIFSGTDKRINFSNYPQGIYIVTAVTSIGLFSEKIIRFE